MSRIGWILGAVLVLAVVWILARYMRPEPVDNDRSGGAASSSATLNESANPEPSTSTATPDNASTSAQYLTYSGDLSIGTGRRLLFFHAPWCPQCRALEASIQTVGVPAGVTIIKVDYDSNQKLRQEYGVTIQTTLVEIDTNGGLVERYVAYEEPSITAVSSHFKLE